MAFQLNNGVITLRPDQYSVKYTNSTLPTPYIMDSAGLGELDGFGKFVKKQFKMVVNVVQRPMRVVKAAIKGDFKKAAGIMANPFTDNPEKRRKWRQRIGGIIIGGASGFATGGYAGMAVGAGVGFKRAKAGKTSLKGYLGTAAIGLAAGAVTSAISGATGIGSSLTKAAPLKISSITGLLSKGAVGTTGSTLTAATTAAKSGGILASITSAAQTAATVFTIGTTAMSVLRQPPEQPDTYAYQDTYPGQLTIPQGSQPGVIPGQNIYPPEYYLPEDSYEAIPGEGYSGGGYQDVQYAEFPDEAMPTSGVFPPQRVAVSKVPFFKDSKFLIASAVSIGALLYFKMPPTTK